VKGPDLLSGLSLFPLPIFTPCRLKTAPPKIIVDHLVNIGILPTCFDLNPKQSAERTNTMGRVSDAKERLMEAVGELFWTGSYDSTTIDQICEKAGVKKGSFYYFFDSKASLAAESLDREWEKYRPTLDARFSASVPPLQRLRSHCEFVYQEQVELKEIHGFVLGCPLCTLGSEISTHEKELQKKVQAMMAYGVKYLESAIRDAQAAGLVPPENAAGKACVLHAYYLGLLTQARIQNDVELLRDMTQHTFELLGVREADRIVA